MIPQPGVATFVQEGSLLCQAVRDALGVDNEAGSGDAAGALAALELDARVLGLSPLAELARALRMILERARKDDPSREELVAFREGLDTLEEALHALGTPDASGARYDEVLVQERARELARRSEPAAEQLVPPPPLPAPGAVAPIAAPGQEWVPRVDEDMVDPFLDECQERLEGLAERLVALERNPGDGELVREIFRDLHTLKGSSAFVGLTQMTRLAHVAEDLVGQLRDGTRSADQATVDALLASLDALNAIVSQAAARAPIDVDVQPALAMLAGRPPAAPAPTATPDEDAPAAAPSSAPRAQAEPGFRQQTLRISFEKLDAMMNLMGELVLAKGRLSLGMGALRGLDRELDQQRQHAARLEGGDARTRARIGMVRTEDLATELGRVHRAFGQLTEDLGAAQQALDLASSELRDQVMKLRMMPIGRGWSKYHRTVRQVAQQLGKRVRLELIGGETELDKVLVEELDDPFTHLLRNAIDHGVESPDERERAGKPAEGVISLSARHRGNQIHVRLADDGHGIDAERVRRKAVERGLVDAETARDLPDEAAFDFIFHPGFSTAQAVSDVSGRGVGMDVVRETISRLKGTVSVTSRAGLGTTIEIRLPLTLAIIQVLLVQVGGQTYAIPLDIVERTLLVPPERLRLACDREVLYESETDLPLLRLRKILGAPGESGTGTGEQPVVIVDLNDQRYALACDGFAGRQEIVIKSLGPLLARVSGAAGATLIGDRCVLILDVPTLVKAGLYAAPLTSAPIPDAARGPAAARILLVEDSDVIRTALRRTMEAAGFDVAEASDGAEGLSLALAEHFDLVTTDVVMPRMDGYELARRLRSEEAYRDTPILMITSKDEQVDRLRGFDSGVDAYLTKPVDEQELLRTLARHLAVSRRPT